MLTNNNRIVQIVKILSRNQGPVTSEVLSEELNITTRTLRNDMKQFREELKEHGITILSKHGVGYQIDIFDEAKYYNFIQNSMQEESKNQLVIPIYPEDRVQYLMRKLLTAKSYLKMDDLCEEIFVSRSTLHNDLKIARERFAYFRLDIETKTAHGICLVGSEFHKRSCISQYFFHVDGNDDLYLKRTKGTNPLQEEIANMLYETMVEESFKLTDIGFQNLVIHIVIAISRLEEGDANDSVFYQHTMQDTKEYHMAGILCRKLEEKYRVVFPEIEQYYIALHLSGKKAMQYTSQTVYMQTHNEELLETIFTEIQKRYDVDLSSDIELYTSLSLHFQPMMNRLRYGMNIPNPLLSQIKKENAEAFEISILAAHVIEEKQGYLVSENEIGYIALHFALAMERYRKSGERKNVIIVCASGMGSSQILLHKVRQKFKDSIANIHVTELYELHSIRQEDFDFILTTVPINIETKIPVVHVQYFLDAKDSRNIQDILTVTDDKFSFIDLYFQNELFFTDLQGKTKEQIIHEMCRRTAKVKNLPEGFEEEVLKREKYAVTEYGNAIAMPHPMHPITEETFVSVGILLRAVKWQNQQVKFVFLVCIKKDSKEALGLFHEALSALVLDKKALQELEKEPTVEHFKEILTALAKQEEGNDIDTIFM